MTLSRHAEVVGEVGGERRQERAELGSVVRAQHAARERLRPTPSPGGRSGRSGAASVSAMPSSQHTQCPAGRNRPWARCGRSRAVANRRLGRASERTCECARRGRRIRSGRGRRSFSDATPGCSSRSPPARSSSPWPRPRRRSSSRPPPARRCEREVEDATVYGAGLTRGPARLLRPALGAARQPGDRTPRTPSATRPCGTPCRRSPGSVSAC